MVMSEPVASRREMATQFGADLLHDPRDGDLQEFIKDHNGGNGANIAAEAVGQPNLVAKCFEVVRPRGQVLMIGVNPEGAALPVDMYDIHYREITLKGAFGRGDVFARTPAEIDTLNLDGVISDHYDLQDVQQAIIDSGEGKGVKFVIKPHR
jgi:threonine dehydrogenase-like Zn-dependent dehydrogenase